MSAQKLNIDFRRRRSTTRIGVLILLLGVVAIISIAARHQHAIDEVAALEVGARKAAPVTLAKAPLPSLSPAELTYMQAVLQQLNIPWERFFSGLEQVATADVVLLNVHPDVIKGTVRVTGEARDFYAALRWITSLNAGEVFHDAQLVEHEVNQQSPEAPIRFALSARWKAE